MVATDVAFLPCAILYRAPAAATVLIAPMHSECPKYFVPQGEFPRILEVVDNLVFDNGDTFEFDLLILISSSNDFIMCRSLAVLSLASSRQASRDR